jgi:hypothetical protein
MKRTQKDSAEPLRTQEGCDHTDGVLIEREHDGRGHARCLEGGAAGHSCEDFEAALRDLQEHAG